MTPSHLRGACVLLLAACSLRAAPVKPVPGPVWETTDVDGNVVRSDDFKGKVVVVDFWATWCVPCRKEMPDYVALQEKYRGDGLVIVGASTDDGGPKAVQRVKHFIAQYNAQAAKEGRPALDYRIVIANGDMIAAFGGLTGVPTTFIIDRHGLLRDRKVGLAAAGTYEKTLLKYLADEDQASLSR